VLMVIEFGELPGEQLEPAVINVTVNKAASSFHPILSLPLYFPIGFIKSFYPEIVTDPFVAVECRLLPATSPNPTFVNAKFTTPLAPFWAVKCNTKTLPYPSHLPHRLN